MGVERELKLKLTPETLEKLVSFLETGCVFKEEVKQQDYYFNHPCRDFKETDEALRIRWEKKVGGERLILTYKGPRGQGSVKVREELNIRIDPSDKEQLINLLEKNGYRYVTVVSKKRKVYMCGSLEYALDEVEGLGSFLEIEVKGKEYPDLIELARELGLDDMIVEKTYLELILENKKDQ